jgi:hypothetical protein
MTRDTAAVLCATAAIVALSSTLRAGRRAGLDRSRQRDGIPDPGSRIPDRVL